MLCLYIIHLGLRQWWNVLTPWWQKLDQINSSPSFTFSFSVLWDWFHSEYYCNILWVSSSHSLWHNGDCLHNLGICFFLPTLLGTVVGRNWSGAPNNPCRVKTIPRPILEKKWYLTPSVVSMMVGLLPLAAYSLKCTLFSLPSEITRFVLCISTFASAMQNSVPAITFIMALTFGCEQVNIMRKYELAKILGTIASVGGATIIIFYKSTLILHQASQPVGSNLEEGSFFNTTKIQNWTLGCIFLLGHYLSWAGWMILQALILKKYPAKLSLTSFTCFFGLTQFLFIAAFVERDPKYWKIYSEEEICTILDAVITSN